MLIKFSPNSYFSLIGIVNSSDSKGKKKKSILTIFWQTNIARTHNFTTWTKHCIILTCSMQLWINFPVSSVFLYPWSRLNSWISPSLLNLHLPPIPPFDSLQYAVNLTVNRLVSLWLNLKEALRSQVKIYSNRWGNNKIIIM